MNFWRRIADFFGLKRNLVILLIATFVIGAGEELWMRFVPKYLQALGATVFVIGLFDGLRTLLGAIYAYPGGVLVDRWGHRRAFLAFNLFSIAGYSLVLLVPHWGAVIAGMFLFLSWTCFSLPATFSLVGATLGANRHSMGVGVQSVIKRLPIMVAPHRRRNPDRSLRHHQRRAHRLDCLDRPFGGDHPGATPTARSARCRGRAARALERSGKVLRGFNAPLRRLLLSDILVRFCERIPFAWVVIYAMDNIGVSAKQIGILTTVEMLAATLCIIPASHFADKHGREPFILVSAPPACEIRPSSATTTDGSTSWRPTCVSGMVAGCAGTSGPGTAAGLSSSGARTTSRPGTAHDPSRSLPPTPAWPGLPRSPPILPPGTGSCSGPHVCLPTTTRITRPTPTAGSCTHGPVTSRRLPAEVMIDTGGRDIIDTALIHENGRVYRFSKDEARSTGRGIYMERGAHLFARDFETLATNIAGDRYPGVSRRRW